MDPQPWPDKYIHVGKPAIKIVNELEEVLKDAQDEKPLQTLLASHPELLKAFMPAGIDRWSWDRPQLGNQFIPDFILCYRNSQGLNWIMIELESPTQRPLTQKSLVAGKLNEAISQIRNWRIWLRQNVAYASQQLGLKGLDAECPGMIVIGRRGMVDASQVMMYKELSERGDAKVMSYDRFLEMARAIQE